MLTAELLLSLIFSIIHILISSRILAEDAVTTDLIAIGLCVKVKVKI